ncbi:MAG: ABC transporter ATP-binding protein [Proteobacteria bacterium]|nr:ABC transporter ATP-binding protein [Pseudomonadota bacterium]
MTEKLLDIKNLTVTFKTDDGRVLAVDDLSFSVDYGETVGLVGESGAGKSVTAMSIPRLVPSPPSQVEHGEIRFKGRDLLKMNIRDMRKIRGKEIGVIFQDPGTALSPLHRVGNQLVEALRMHRNLSFKEAWATAESWLANVKIPDAKERMFVYPHQLSGGMQQRVMIAMALIQEPDLMIADEPTTALDVTIQAQVFNLIRDMKKNDSAMLLITHDMGVVWEMCDRVLVMYASQLVEEGLKDEIFSHPAHPYTEGLLKSIPSLGAGTGKRLPSIRGQVPSALDYPKGCRFNDRCPHAFDRCEKESPESVHLSKTHRASCFLLVPEQKEGTHGL